MADKLINTATTLSALRGALAMLEAIAAGKTFDAGDYYDALEDLRAKVAEREAMFKLNAGVSALAPLAPPAD
jgi:hypothetical protein